MPFLDIFKKDSSLDIKIKETFANPPTLSTQRLLLVNISPEHASDMYEYSCDPDVTRYLTWSCHSSVKETERYIKLLQKRYTAGVFNDWGLIHKETGKFIGTCGFTSFDYEKNTAEIAAELANPILLQKLLWSSALKISVLTATVQNALKETTPPCVLCRRWA